jgi:tellurite resistance protein TehA-like permease
MPVLTAPRVAHAPQRWDLPPNWFAAVMGTGIIALAAAGLPVAWPGQREFAAIAWVLAAVLLVVLLAGIGGGWALHPKRFQAQLAHPVTSHFLGALPMAMLTVGAGALLVGRDLIGLRAALAADALLWIAGTATGLACTVWALRRGRPAGDAFGGWLMPLVPPMVSATTGGLLVPHLPAGLPQRLLLVACYGLFALSLVASIAVAGPIWAQVRACGPGPAALVPTVWIMLGPLGQSITAANVLGGAASTAFSGTLARLASSAGVAYGLAAIVPVLIWCCLAGAATARTAHTGLPFTLAWWSFVFPAGTVVTGVSQLAVRTGLPGLSAVAAALFVALVATWVVVATRTVDAALRGQLSPGAVPARPARPPVSGHRSRRAHP